MVTVSVVLKICGILYPVYFFIIFCGVSFGEGSLVVHLYIQVACGISKVSRCLGHPHFSTMIFLLALLQVFRS